jgi:1-acyl-sn-glycerol-3-phosphate acyltransferase
VAVALRAVAALAVVLVAAIVLPALPPARVPWALRAFARAVLRALGVRHAVHGRPVRHGALMVANHVSWLDILVLAAHYPCRLLAKREVRGWPVVGRIAVAAGTLFIDRARPRTLPATVAEVADALAAGSVVAVFPEGTTWCGRASGTFRPALFEAAVAARAAVAPVRLDFVLGDGSATTVPAFVGDDTLMASLWRVITARGLAVTLRAYPLLRPVAGSSRRRLAAAAQATVSGSAEGVTVPLSRNGGRLQPFVGDRRQSMR